MIESLSRWTLFWFHLFVLKAETSEDSYDANDFERNVPEVSRGCLKQQKYDRFAAV